MTSGVISAAANPHATRFLDALARSRGLFACTIATTETALIPGISAAGATPELRRFTAQADVEYLFYGKTSSIPEIPRNPLGPPSPVIISKAALNLMPMPLFVIDAGCAVKAQVPAFVFRAEGLRCITSGRSFDGGAALIRQARSLAGELARLDRFVVLGESVPGGTTTAQSLLEFAGINAGGRVSSSMVENAHDIKGEVVKRAHAAAGIGRERLHADPVGVVEQIGDSMQLVNAAMAAVLAGSVPVVLAGGTQMLAVLALMGVMDRTFGLGTRWENVAVCTTRWVLDDRKADFRGLAAEIAVPASIFAADLNFSSSSFPGLVRYEEGLVKEGVGAGGLAGAGFMTGAFSPASLLAEIERLFALMG